MAEDILVQNAKLRELLRRTSPLMLRRMRTETITSLGSTVRAKLQNVGLLTDVYLRIRLNVNLATGTSAVYAASKKGAFAAIPRVRLQDFDGSDRCAATGFQLYVRDLVRGQDAYARLVGAADTAVPMSALTHPNVPTSTGNQTIDFWLHIPVAKDCRTGDLRGMMITQTGVGEVHVVVDIASSLFGTGDNVVFNAVSGSGHAVTLTSGSTVDVYQAFFLPQQVEGVVPIPPLDTITVYELNGAWSTSDNLASDQEKLISLPNARQIYGVYYEFINNGVLADMKSHRIIANGNAILREYPEVEALEMMQRWYLGRDTMSGVYFHDFTTAPIQTNLFGNIQLGLTPSGTLTSPSLQVMYEAIYIKGSALSGISQAG